MGNGFKKTDDCSIIILEAVSSKSRHRQACDPSEVHRRIWSFTFPVSSSSWFGENATKEIFYPVPETFSTKVEVTENKAIIQQALNKNVTCTFYFFIQVVLLPIKTQKSHVGGENLIDQRSKGGTTASPSLFH